jgi:PKD repeat protein
MIQNKLLLALGLSGLVALSVFFIIAPAAAQADLTATIVNPPAGSTFKVDEEILFQGTATGGNSPYAYVWDFGDQTQGGGQSYSKKYSAAGKYTVQLTVTDFSGGQAKDTIEVNIEEDGQPVKPVISNLRVTDITSSSVIVRWTTDIAADSRVIYDTVSHPNIADQQPPNFGYGFSTITQDPSGVTEHAVTITGLTPKTTYYLRALSRAI